MLVLNPHKQTEKGKQNELRTSNQRTKRDNENAKRKHLVIVRQ